ncbi:TPA: A-kinase anchor protein 7 isoforms alpha and beta, variant 3 [Trebouxia sp. C0005]
MDSIAASQPGSQSPLHDANSVIEAVADGSAWSKHPQAECKSTGQSDQQVRPPSEKTIRPNFFFALQVSRSEAVVAAIKSVHSSLLQHSAGLQSALVEPETAHLTIMVTALQAENDVQRAEAAMESFAADTALDSTLAQPLSLTLEGLSHFRHQVLFLDIKKDAQHERLMAFVQAVRQHMQAAGVNSTDDRDFVAHVTIAKMSKVKDHRRKRGSGPNKIAEEAYAKHTDIQASTVLVTELQLCSMQGRQPGSYYNIQKSVRICPAQFECTT